jgi:hypothetical protein
MKFVPDDPSSSINPSQKRSQTMVKRTLRPGVGARCSVLLSKLHPGDYVAQHFPNTTRQDRLEGLVATRREEVVRNVIRTSPIPIIRDKSSPQAS